MQSVTKTVFSAVVGVAIERELTCLKYACPLLFNRTQVTNIDEKKSRKTLYQLLIMSTGLDWDGDVPYTDPTNTFIIVAMSPDWF